MERLFPPGTTLDQLKDYFVKSGAKCVITKDYFGPAISCIYSRYDFGFVPTDWAFVGRLDADNSHIMSVEVNRYLTGLWAMLPGMTVTAEVKMGSQRVLDYVLSPVGEALSLAAREMSNMTAKSDAVASWYGRPISHYLLLLVPFLMSLLNAIPIGAWQIAYAQTEMRQSFDIDGIVFHIPTSIPWKSFINTASGEQTLELFVPPKQIRTGFADVQGHKKQLLLLTIRTDVQRLGSIDTYIQMIRGKTPTIIGTYRIYPAGGFDFYVSTDNSRPPFFWCEVRGVGVLEGQPRICQVKEDIDDLINFPVHLTPVSVEYGFTFDDLPNLQKIDGEIRALLRSMLTGKN